MNPEGRPRLPKNKAKSEFLPKIRVSETQKAKFEQKAKDTGQGFSEWVRKALEKACE